MSSPPEPSFVQKLRHAEAHFQSLRDPLKAFPYDHPCAVKEEFYADSKKREWRVSDDPPDADELWSPVYGEFFYNCRSALDQLLWALVRRYKGSAPDARLYYPIFKDPVEFIYKMREPLKSLPPDVLTLVERSQPYNGVVGPDCDSLALLHKLSNLDKHRRPHLATYSSHGYVSWGEYDHTDVRPHLGPVKKGTLLLEFRVSKPEDMDVGFQPHFEIAFAEGEAGYTSAEQVLLMILSKVRRIISALQPFL